MLNSKLLENPEADRGSRSVGKRAQRRGSVLLFLILVLPVVIILAAFVINIAYMELGRTEMYIAADAAARAGGREFTLTGNLAQGRARAREAAGRNLVAGQAPVLSDADMVFGESTRSGLGNRYTFNPGGANPNALQVTINRSGGGGLPILMQAFTPANSVNASQMSRSTQLEIDIALVIDRSGSMAYAVDERADPFNIPRNAPNPIRFELQPQPVTRMVENPDTGLLEPVTTIELVPVPIPWDFCDPITFPSRWLDLAGAVNVFLGAVAASPTAERMSLVTYSTSAQIDCDLTTSYGAITSALNTYTSQFCGGATNIAGGIRQAQNSLAGGNSRPWASKVIVLMTDGIATAGGSPTGAAANAADEGILIFTVTFSNEADQSSMQRVAEIGNGQHYHANSSADLQAAFLDIARQIPVVLTQ